MRPGYLLVTAGALAALVALSSCGRDEARRARSTVQLMEDPVVLQMVLNRCNQSAAVHDEECRNAREAVGRLEQQRPAEERKQKQVQAASDFERAREQRRQREELERRRQEASEKVDPYTMPLVEPMQGAEETQSEASPPQQLPPSS